MVSAVGAFAATHKRVPGSTRRGIHFGDLRATYSKPPEAHAARRHTANMKRLPVWLGIAAVLWTILLLQPYGRANFRLQAGYWGEDDGAFSGQIGDWGQNLPDAAAIRRRYPDDREVAFGLLSGSNDDQVQALTALSARFPRDPALIAALNRTLGNGLPLLRFDNPVYDSNWPKPRADTPTSLSAEQRGKWLTLLGLADRGIALEPNNTYFDYVKIAGFLALHRDAEALAVLHSAAGKTNYDSHEGDQVLAALHAYSRALPLSPGQQETVKSLQLSDSFTDESRTRMIAAQIKGVVMTARMEGRDQAAIDTAYDLLRFARTMRLHTYGYIGSLTAYEAEQLAIYSVRPLSVRIHYARNPSRATLLASPFNLAGYALAEKRPDVARDVVAEEANLAKWNAANIKISDLQAPAPWIPFESGLQERWGRLLLRTLVPCLGLLILLELPSRRWRSEETAAALSPLRGVLAGAGLLLILLAGDSVVAVRSALGDFGDVGYYFVSQSPGILALAPSLSIWFVAGCFLLLGLARARKWQNRDAPKRAFLTRIRDGSGQPGNPSRFDFTPLVTFIARATFWTALVLAYGALCTTSKTGFESLNTFCTYNGLIFLGFWLVALATSLRQWSKLPDRRQAMALAILNCRRLAAGYVVAGLILYPITAMAVIPMEKQFTQLFEAYARAGETATVRRNLGL